MATEPRLAFDPLERAGELWEERIGDATAMRLATSIMRVHQLVISRLDAALKPHGITFARFEVLRLISFSRAGRLPLSKIGERLMVHPTSVTNAIDRLEAQGLVVREPDPKDRRRTFASLTAEGERVVEDATAALMDVQFGVAQLDPDDQQAAYALLRGLRQVDFGA
ncbi:MAG: MarR family transcriptional regulator [Propionibacteriales bacterium]|nr:MarR family transcriptional regulator [Propionibacteriales bacterium]